MEDVKSMAKQMGELANNILQALDGDTAQVAGPQKVSEEKGDMSQEKAKKKELAVAKLRALTNKRLV